MKWFADEDDFSAWLQSRLREQRFHVQPIEDGLRTGLPDLNAGGDGVEAWLEVKLCRPMRTVHDLIQLKHPLLAVQYHWLMTRRSLGIAQCAVVVAWQTEAGQYVSFVPIIDWKERQHHNLMTWGLCAYTTTLPRLMNGDDRISDLLCSRRHPARVQRGVRT